MSGTTYNFTYLDYLNGIAFVQPGGLNNAGEVVGSIGERTSSDGFSWRNNQFSLFDYSGATYTNPNAINSSGEIVGAYTIISVGLIDGLPQTVTTSEGFTLVDGVFTSVTILPDAETTDILAIDNNGDTAGYYTTSDGDMLGYVDIDGSVTTVSGPADASQVEVAGVNDSGNYVGNYYYTPVAGQNGIREAFEVSNGVFSNISYPGSTGTYVSAINNAGYVAGYYNDALGEHGFIYHDGQYQAFAYPDSNYVELTGINDLGQIVGRASDGAFLATPESSPCYCRGTRILTDRGEIAVEDLRIGDRLVTNSGAARAIRWIGTRSYAGRFVAGNRDVLPVLIRADALADGIPRRDLWVSPLHAMYLDGMLVPAAALVNGISIRQAEAVERVDYFHVELETHDVILAEGAASETFVDDDSRGMFHNAASYRALYPRATTEPARYCAPRVEGGEAVEALFQRIRQRAMPVSATATASLTGHLDSVDRERIVGWAHDGAKPVRLRILDNGIEIGRVMARGHRDDLRAAGIGDGRGGFDFIVPGGLSPLVRHVIAVQRVSDGRELAHSPMVLEAEQDRPLSPWTTASSAGMDGYVDELTRTRISGWVRNIAEPDVPVALRILDNGQPIARVLANRYRPDLARTKHGTGRCGFEVDIEGGLSPLTRHVIAFRREPDGCLLGGPPFVIEAADSFTPAVEQAVAAAVAAVRPGAARARMLAFLTAQAERLRQNAADDEARRPERLARERSRRREGRAPRDPGLRALVIDERVPVAGRDAGSQAVLSHMRALRRLGYAVSFAAAEEMAGALTDDGITACAAPFYNTVEDVLRRQAGCFDVVYLHRAEIAASYLALARRCNPRARIMYSVADLHHVRLARQAAIEDRPEILAASRRLKLAEIVAACSANAVITHSAAEVAMLRRLAPQADIHHVAWDVPVARTQAGFAARAGIAFIGAYSHAPNVDAAHWLVETIMPLVWRHDPSITCRLVGTDMPASIRRLARPGIVAVGAVEDLGAAVFDRVRLTVAPLRYGAGINGKVLASLAAGVPCVMSTVAAEGMALCPTLETLVGGDAMALATLIRDLHRDGAANGRATKAGMAMIRRDFSAAAVDAGLRDAIAGGEVLMRTQAS